MRESEGSREEDHWIEEVVSCEAPVLDKLWASRSHSRMETVGERKAVSLQGRDWKLVFVREVSG